MERASSGVLEVERVRRIRDRVGERDWRDVTVHELAEAAGLSRMTLHRRGIGKSEILAQLGSLLEEEHRAALLPALVATGDARTRLALALAALCEVNERYLGTIEALDAAAPLIFHEDGDGEVLSRATFTDGLRRILEDGVADGTLRVDDPVRMATLLFNAVGWTYRHMRSGHRWPADQARSEVVDLLLHGVARPPADR